MPLESFSVALQRVAVARMVRQLSEVYSVVRVSTMSELAPFIAFGQVRGAAAQHSTGQPCGHAAAALPACPHSTPMSCLLLRLHPAFWPAPLTVCHPGLAVWLVQAEQMIVDAVRNGYFQARFDHKNNTVHFGGQVCTHAFPPIPARPLAASWPPGVLPMLCENSRALPLRCLGASRVHLLAPVPCPCLACRRLSLSECAATSQPWPSASPAPSP